MHHVRSHLPWTKSPSSAETLSPSPSSAPTRGTAAMADVESAESAVESVDEVGCWLSVEVASRRVGESPIAAMMGRRCRPQEVCYSAVGACTALA